MPQSGAEAGQGGSRALVWGSLAAICGLGLVLRLVHLSASPWYDEILTWVRFVRLPWGELLTTYTSLNNHIFYSLLAKASFVLFGENTFALRLPAALLGVGGIAALFALSRRVAGNFEAILASLLLSVSYHHIWFSQNARGYTGLLCFSLVASWVVARHEREDRLGKGLWLLYALMVALSGYTHLSAAFFFLAQALTFAWFAVVRRGDKPVLQQLSGPLIGLGVGALVTAALYAPIVPQMIDTFGSVAQGASESVAKTEVKKWENPLWTVFEIVRSFGVLGVAMPPALALVFWGGRDLYRKSPIVVASFALHIPLTLVILKVVGMRIWPRYFFADIGFVLMCLAAGVSAMSAWIAGWLERRGRGASGPGLQRKLRAGLGAFGVLASLVLLPKNYRSPKQDFEGALAYVQTRAQPGDVRVTMGLAATPLSEFYAAGYLEVTDLAGLEALERTRPEGTRLFVLYAFPAHTRSHFPDVMAQLNARYEKVDFEGSLGDGWVVVYQGPP